MTVRVLEQARQPNCQQACYYLRGKQLLAKSAHNGRQFGKLLLNPSSNGSTRFLHGICDAGQRSTLLRNHQRLNQQLQCRQMMLLRILRAASKVRYLFLGAAGTAGVGVKLVNLS